MFETVVRDDLVRLNEYLWEIPTTFSRLMRVPARIFASETLMTEMLRDRSLPQLVNVTTLPGIAEAALAMPDAHEGYGFPVGGVAATDPESGGVISPGGIGFDVGCGVRLLRSNLTFDEVKDKLHDLGRTLFGAVPSGVGRGGRLDLAEADLDKVLVGGAPRLVELGYGETADLSQIESGGVLPGADAARVSGHAKARGRDQLGTMGAGNHFVEACRVEHIFDAGAAAEMHLFPDQAVVLIHTGSRGLGHQIATDYIRIMLSVQEKYGISLPDRELACAPFNSPEGQDYFAAMAAGANFAFANRQLIMAEVRQAWKRVFGDAGGPLAIVYDVAHNVAKLEEYVVEGVKKKLVVHRKGATRSFPGQPVLIPGSMGTGSFVLVGQEGAMKNSFGSSCHGAGRRMSRTEAKRHIGGRQLRAQLLEQGIVVNAGSMSGMAEEAPFAYKDVDEVVNVVDGAGLAKKVARLKPLAVVIG